MKSYIIFVPALIATLYLFYLSKYKWDKNVVALTFLNVYLPTLLLLPQDYSVHVPLVFNFNFDQATLIPIILAYGLTSKVKDQLPSRLCLLDFLIGSFVLACVFSEFINIELTKAQKVEYGDNLWKTVLFHNVFEVLLPYFFARTLIYPLALTHVFAKRIVILSIISVLISTYEWRFVINLHEEFFRPFFNETEPWIPAYRYDLVRIAGPFGHPILFGTSIASAFLFNNWLTKNTLWKNNFQLLPFSSKSKGIIIGIFLFIGLCLTISRGPFFSTLLALMFAGIGYSRHKFFKLAIRFSILVVVGLCMLQATASYSEMNMENSSVSVEERNAIYRAQLVDKYIDDIYEKPWFGWGSYNWPSAAGMVSIDNEYLWLALKHGLIALGLLVSIFLNILFKLTKTGLKIPYENRFDSSLDFTLISIILMLFITLITVFMGTQIEPLTFMMIGLSQGFLETYQARHRNEVQQRRLKM